MIHVQEGERTKVSRKIRKKGRFIAVVVGVVALATGAAACGSSASSNSSSGSTTSSVHGVSGHTITIGVPLPLSGADSSNGVPFKQGIQFAAQQFNQSGGVDGYQIKLDIVDDQSSPSVAAQVGVQLATVSNVYALVGGFGSTEDYAWLKAVKPYGRLTIHAGSSSLQIANEVGSEPWYYHVYLWDPDNAKALVNFYNSLSPRPKRVAVVDVNNAFGTDNATYAIKALKAAGYDVVAHETFPDGATDLSSTLIPLRAAHPDAVYVISDTVGDDVLYANTMSALGIHPKVSVLVQGADIRTDYGSSGVGLVFETGWTADPALSFQTKFDKQWASAHNGSLPNQGNVIAYTAMQTLGDAIRQAKSISYSAVEKALNTMKFSTPYGSVNYHKEYNVLHELTGYSSELFVQWAAPNSVTKGEIPVYPPKLATQKVAYPAGP